MWNYSSSAVTGCRVVGGNATVEKAYATYMGPPTTSAAFASVKHHAYIVGCGCRWRIGRFGLNRFINQHCHEFSSLYNQRGQFLVQPFEMRQDLVAGAGGRERTFRYRSLDRLVPPRSFLSQTSRERLIPTFLNPTTTTCFRRTMELLWSFF